MSNTDLIHNQGEIEEKSEFRTCRWCLDKVFLIPDGKLRWCKCGILGVDHTSEYTRVLGSSRAEKGPANRSTSDMPKVEKGAAPARRPSAQQLQVPAETAPQAPRQLSPRTPTQQRRTGGSRTASPKPTRISLAAEQPRKSASACRMIMLGSGCSSGVPSIQCVMGTKRTCKTCLEVLADPFSKNKRRNPSVLLEKGNTCVMIDCGKSFREVWINAMRMHGAELRRPTAILLTHAHADAFFGLDDVRELLERDNPDDSMDIYCTEETMQVVSRTFPYLVDKSHNTGSYISNLNFKMIPTKGQFSIGTIDFFGVPLPHGSGTSLAFQFGNVLYMSDVSDVPQKLRRRFRKMELALLIIDALKLKRVHASHLTLTQAIEVVRTVKPQRAVLTGMSHEFNYNDITTKVLATVEQKEGLVVEMGFDGMVLDGDIKF